MESSFFDRQSIQKMDKRYRINFINSLTGFKSVTLIGTRNENNISNLAIFSQVIHVGADPPLIGVLFRPHVVKRDTLENITKSKFFTVNHINSEFYKKAHHTSARWEKSEFESCGLTEQFINDFEAPFVEESSIKLGLKFKERLDIKSNGTHLIVGEIIAVHLSEQLINSDGYIDIEKGDVVTSSGLDSYHKTTRISRLSYAKTDHFPKDL